MWGCDRRSPVAVDCGLVDWRVRLGGGGVGGEMGGFSHESEDDLGVMVRDFLEIGSCGADSLCSSDSDSNFSDLSFLADKISFCKRSVDQYESDLMSVVHSLILSITETDHQFGESSPCNASCIKFSLIKLLQHSGYDAAVCSTKWQGTGKVPGGEHEYIDVVRHCDSGTSERFIVDIDFRSHFEIARAVESYNAVLTSLPLVYVGSIFKLKQFLQVMEEAARSSLKQNSMPLPPWRSFAYLQAKWDSTCQRNVNASSPCDQQECDELLRRMKSFIQSEMKSKGLAIPIKNKHKRRLKLERYMDSSFRAYKDGVQCGATRK